MKNADGLILLEGFKGSFTEIRFWNQSIPASHIQRFFDKPLSNSFELRKNKGITMSGTSQSKQIPRRGTLIAPPGKSKLSIGLAPPPRRQTVV